MKTNVKLIKILKYIFVTIGIDITATVLSYILQYFGLTEVNIVVVYILSVLITSSLTQGYVYGIVASVIATFSFNFFFALPLFSFAIDDPDYIFTFIVMLIAAIITSTLTSKTMRMTELSNKRERQSHSLYHITSSLSKTVGIDDIAAVSAKLISDYLECEIRCYVIDEPTKSVEKVIYNPSTGYQKQSYPFDSLSLLKDKFYTVPIQVQGDIFALICLPQHYESMEDPMLFDSIVLQITIAMERELLTRDKERAQIEIKQERFKSNLLRAVSHDLRTPLTGITGSAEMLIKMLKDQETLEIAEGIREDADWLTRLVENILNLTRIQEKRLSSAMKSEIVEEVVSSAISRVQWYTAQHNITASVPDEALFVPMDSRLIEQVLINLLDNAIKHGNPDSHIYISIQKKDHKVWFEVSDNGGGIHEKSLSKIFDMFYTEKENNTDAKRGIGLGLTICREIIKLHHGELTAENNCDGGATFRFYLNADCPPEDNFRE